MTATMNLERQNSIKALLAMAAPLDLLARNIAVLEWDFEGQKFELTANHLVNAIQRSCVARYLAPIFNVGPTSLKAAMISATAASLLRFLTNLPIPY
jgi:hypothetical protein